MSQVQVGAQMFTLRDHCKTPSDIAKTCQRVREMGYQAIQVSAFGPIETPELAKILSDTGLTCAATHVSLDLMRDVNKCIEYHEAIGCKLAAIGGWRPEDGNHTLAACKQFAQEYSEIAKPLAEKGLRIGYHNHSRELASISDGSQRILDVLIENTDQSIWFEIDTYWIAHGGGDPCAWLEKVSGRCTAIHVKDMKVTPSQEQLMCEVGDGNLNWPGIMDVCKQAGVEWYLVERDSGELDPFESLQISYNNLKAMGLN